MMDRAELRHGFTRLRQGLVVLAQPPVTPQPGERPFHHPANRQRHEAARAGRPADPFHPIRPPVQAQPIIQGVIVILVVREDDLQPREVAATHLGEHLLGRTGVVHVGGRHDHGDQQPQRVHEDMPLATVDLLAAVGADLRAALGRLDRLAVDGGGAGRRPAARPEARLLAERVEESLPSAVPLPPLEVVVDGLPGREVVGQRPPGTALAGDVKQGVAHAPQVRLAGPAAGSGRRNQRLKQRPLLVRKIARIGLVFHTLFYGSDPLLEQTLRESWFTSKVKAGANEAPIEGILTASSGSRGGSFSSPWRTRPQSWEWNFSAFLAEAVRLLWTGFINHFQVPRTPCAFSL